MTRFAIGRYVSRDPDVIEQMAENTASDETAV